MVAALTRPAATHELRLVDPRRLPVVEWASRSGAALRRGPLSSREDILSVDLCRGRAALGALATVDAGFADVVTGYIGTAARLEEELTHRSRPHAVHVSPYADPFPPLAALQAETDRVVEALVRHDVEAWLMTRGYIRPATRAILAANRRQVRVTLALSTLDRGLQRSLEPWTASPCLRLRQLTQLRELGIPVQLAIEPLVPRVTDTRANLNELFCALAAIGVDHVTASYLALGSGTEAALFAALEPYGWGEMALEEYGSGPRFTASGGSLRLLPKARRQRGYAALMALASEHGIRVSVSAAGNPDFAGARPTAGGASRQRLLPTFLSMSQQLQFA
jgi:DNA repair photolyase